MINKLLKWQNKRYSQKLKIFLGTVSSTIFIFGFIPALPWIFFRRLDEVLTIHQILSWPLNIFLGLPISLVGLALFAWTIWLFLTTGQGTQIPLIPTQKLVVKGPFAYSRNPMYLGVIIWVGGLGILANSFSFIFIGLIIPFLYLVYVKLVEEKELAQRFGSQYLAYRQKVPFLIPQLKRK